MDNNETIQVYHITFGEEPKKCSTCGGENWIDCGLVAPKCGDCGSFEISHMSFGSNIGTEEK